MSLSCTEASKGLRHIFLYHTSSALDRSSLVVRTLPEWVQAKGCSILSRVVKSYVHNRSSVVVCTLPERVGVGFSAEWKQHPTLVDSPPLLGSYHHGAASHAACGLQRGAGLRQEISLVVHLPGMHLLSISFKLQQWVPHTIQAQNIWVSICKYFPTMGVIENIITHQGHHAGILRDGNAV